MSADGPNWLATAAPVSTAGDGIPDEWKVARKLDRRKITGKRKGPEHGI